MIRQLYIEVFAGRLARKPTYISFRDMVTGFIPSHSFARRPFGEAVDPVYACQLGLTKMIANPPVGIIPVESAAPAFVNFNAIAIMSAIVSASQRS